MADSVNVQHKLQMLFETKLDDKSKQQVGKQIKGMLENAVISFDEAEARHNLESIIKMMNKLFSKAEMEGFDAEKLLKMPSQQALQEIASRATEDFQKAFDQALKKSGGIKIDFGTADMSAMTEPLNQMVKELADVGERVASATKKSVSEIEESFKALKTDKKISSAAKNIDKLLTQIDGKKFKAPDKIEDAISKLTSLRSELSQSKTDNDPWEIQYQHLLKYVNAYEAAQKKFGENLVANNPQLQSLYEMLSPKAKTVKISLENFVNMARGDELVEDKHKPWAREKTLQEVKQVLKNGITVNGKAEGDSGGKSPSSSELKPEEPPKSANKPKPQKTKDPIAEGINKFIKEYTEGIEALFDAPIEEWKKLRQSMMAKLSETFKFKDGVQTKDLLENLEFFELNEDEKKLTKYLKEQIEAPISAATKSVTEAAKKPVSKVKSTPDTKSVDNDQKPSGTVAIDEGSLKKVLTDITYKVKVEGEETGSHASFDDEVVPPTELTEQEKLIEQYNQNKQKTVELLKKEQLSYEEILYLVKEIQTEYASAFYKNKNYDLGDDASGLMTSAYGKLRRGDMIDARLDKAINGVGMTAEEGARILTDFQNRQSGIMEDISKKIQDIENDDAESIEKENGALEDKLERLQELSDTWGQKMSQAKRDRYEALNQKEMDSGLSSKEEDRMSELYEEIESADAALEEFGETYDKIILKLSNGKKIDILPDDSGLGKLFKFGDEYGESYNGVEIADVVFERVKKAVDIIEDSMPQEISSEKDKSDTSDIEALKGVLSEITYNVNVVKDDDNDNKVSIDETSLEAVLNRVTYNAKIIQDTDAPNSEKAALIDIEALKSALGDVTYNVKIAPDDTDKTANKIALDDATLEPLLERVFANILKPQVSEGGNSAYSAMPRAEATKYLQDNHDYEVWNNWYSKGLDPFRTQIAQTLENDIKLRNAALNQMWDEYKHLTGTDVSFEDFLNTRIPLYRGESSDSQSRSDRALSFSLSPDAAKEFGENVLKVWLRPIDTLGMANPTAMNQPEAEVLIPKTSVLGYDQWHESLKANLDVGAANAPWAREDTLKTVKGVLDKIQENTAKNKTVQSGRAKTASDKTSSTRKTSKVKVPQEYEELIRLKQREYDLEKKYENAKDGSTEKQYYQEQLEALRGTIDAQKIIHQNDEQELKLAKMRADAEREIGAIRAKQADKNLKAEIKQNEENARMSKARSIRGRAVDSITNVALLDGLSNQAKESIVEDLVNKIKTLDEYRARIQEGDDSIIDDFKKLQVEIDKASKELNEFVALQNLVTDDSAIRIGDNVRIDTLNIENYRKALENLVQTQYGNKATVGDFDYTTKQLNFTVKNGRREVTEYKMAWDKVMQTYVAIPGKTKKVESALTKILKKAKEFSAYFTGSSLIYKGWNEIVKGIQYIREIDKALTELKKVTDETAESYERFVEAASKTADKVGSTISNIVSSTADWARIGYSLEEAASLAESTAILLNVSEFQSIEDATSALTSTLQAFSYTAEQSMDVVNVLNEVGKLVARR